MSQEETQEQLDLSSLAPNQGARRPRKRVGAGEGSGNGKTCGRGQKGQKSRSGGSVPRGFEGGQMPIHRRLPKRGFRSRKQISGENNFRTVSLTQLQNIAGDASEVSLELFADKGILRRRQDKVKVLGGGEVSAKLVVTAHAFSASAQAAIEKAGGEARVAAAK